MFERTTIKVLLVIAVAYAGIWLPYVVCRNNLPAYLTAPYAVLGLAQAIPVYILNGIGIPGLLQNNGHCGWGWCGPTVFGYVVLVIFWVVVVWLIAWFISNLTSAGKDTDIPR
jgi:ribose/xylose/arabinose/galactoside ABC-type transport system permease subunit